MVNSKYDKPKCDCGNTLYARRNEVWSVGRKITTNGELSNYTMKIQTNFDDYTYEIKLCCDKCGKTYLADYDSEDRIIRGDEDLHS